jgi:hypothetical protein
MVDVEAACQRAIPFALVLAAVWFANAHATLGDGKGAAIVGSAMVSVIGFALIGIKPVRVGSPIATIVAGAWAVMLGGLVLGLLESLRSLVAVDPAASVEPYRFASTGIRAAAGDVEQIFPFFAWLPLVSGGTAWFMALCDPD